MLSPNRLLVLLGLFVANLSLAATTAHAAARPNVLILIYADDLGYGDLSCFGATKIKTPNIDRLAKEGRLFTDAHSPSAVCTPSRYGLLTGEYPWRIGSRS
ncbi:MAG: sulfatase-like hydrolase/transferase, partial [Planctomycetaceae bacterium]|nr:sulfatase-like hydrolase/transferase [Planctomycetaceae bacterium]